MLKPWNDDRLAANGRAVKDNFADWFGDSKVVDVDGAPLVAYHGTDAAFDAFDTAAIGTNFGLDKTGFFFSDDQDSANRSRKSYPKGSRHCFSEQDKANAAGGRVIAAYVKIDRPLTPDKVPGWESSMGTSAINLYDLNRDAIEKELATGQYDGVIIKSEGRRLIAVSSPFQIKCAIGNAGLYLKNSPSLSDSESELWFLRTRQARMAAEKIVKKSAPQVALC